MVHRHMAQFGYLPVKIKEQHNHSFVKGIVNLFSCDSPKMYYALTFLTPGCTWFSLTNTFFNKIYAK